MRLLLPQIFLFFCKIKIFERCTVLPLQWTASLSFSLLKQQQLFQFFSKLPLALPVTLSDTLRGLSDVNNKNPFWSISLSHWLTGFYLQLWRKSSQALWPQVEFNIEFSLSWWAFKSSLSDSHPLSLSLSFTSK